VVTLDNKIVIKRWWRERRQQALRSGRTARSINSTPAEEHQVQQRQDRTDRVTFRPRVSPNRRSVARSTRPVCGQDRLYRVSSFSFWAVRCEGSQFHPQPDRILTCNPPRIRPDAEVCAKEIFSTLAKRLSRPVNNDEPPHAFTPIAKTMWFRYPDIYRRR